MTEKFQRLTRGGSTSCGVAFLCSLCRRRRLLCLLLFWSFGQLGHLLSWDWDGLDLVVLGFPLLGGLVLLLGVTVRVAVLCLAWNRKDVWIWGSLNQLKLACLSWVGWRECHVHRICFNGLFIGWTNSMSTQSAQHFSFAVRGWTSHTGISCPCIKSDVVKRNSNFEPSQIFQVTIGLLKEQILERCANHFWAEYLFWLFVSVLLPLSTAHTYK